MPRKICPFCHRRVYSARKHLNCAYNPQLLLPSFDITWEGDEITP